MYFEVSLLQKRWLKEKECPDFLATTIKVCDPKKEPNLFSILCIGCTLHVTSSECKRSFSVLRRLHIWLRASMKTSRFSSVALMKIHYDVYVDYDRAVKIFLDLHPRVFNKDNLVY